MQGNNTSSSSLKLITKNNITNTNTSTNNNCFGSLFNKTAKMFTFTSVRSLSFISSSEMKTGDFDDECTEALLSYGGREDYDVGDFVEAKHLLSSGDKKSFRLFTLLPIELQIYTLTHLLPCDLASVGATCHYLNALSQKNSLWRVLAKKKWNLTCTRRFKPMNWRSYYKQQTLLRKKGGFKWQKMSLSSQKPNPRAAHTGCTLGKKIYYVGGQSKDPDVRLAEIHCFDTETSQFKDLTPFITGGEKIPNFARHQAQIIDGKIYCFGGFDLQQFYGLAVFDPADNTWTYPILSGDIPEPRSNHGSAVVDRKLYIFGGSIGDNVNKYETINDFYSLDIDTKQWTKIEAKNTPTSRVGHKMIGINGKVFLFGGGVWSSSEGWVHQYNQSYIYNPKTNEWSEIISEKRPTISTYPYIFKLGMNILLFGGASYLKNNVTKELWMLDFVSGQWEFLEPEGDCKPSARSMGSADVIGSTTFFWGGYCGGVIPEETDFYCLQTLLDQESADEESLQWIPEKESQNGHKWSSCNKYVFGGVPLLTYIKRCYNPHIILL